MIRAWATGIILLLMGEILAALCPPLAWLRLLIMACCFAIYMWLVSNYRHSDFAWWVVLHPRESPRLLLLMGFMEYMKLKWSWKLWKSKRVSKKKKRP